MAKGIVFTKKVMDNWVTGVIFTFIAAVMAGWTVKTQSQTGDISGMCINLVFLTGMWILIMAAEVFSFRKMRPAAQEIEAAQEMVKSVEDTQKLKMWENLRKQPVSFTDQEMDEKWQVYMIGEAGSGAKILEDEDAILFRFKSAYCDMVPGLLTGLGILGTFIGLIISMKAFSGGDMDAITESLGTMIGGMNVAFYTSIYGVLLSVIFNLCNRMQQQKLADAVASFRALLTAEFASAAGDNAMDNLLHYEDSIHTELKTIEETMTSGIGREIADGMKPMFHQIEQTLGNVIGDYRTLQADSMRDVAADFSAEVCKQLDKHINTLGNSVDRLSRSQDAMTGQMNNLLAEIGGTMQETHEINLESAQVIRQFQQYTAHLDQLTQKAENAFSAIESYSREMYSASSEQTQAAQQQNAVLNQLSGLITDLKYYQAQCAKLTVPVEEIVNNLNTAVTTNNQGLKNSEQTLAQIIQENREHQDEMTKELAGLISIMQTSEESHMRQMEKIVNEQNLFMKEYMDRNEKQIRLLTQTIRQMEENSHSYAMADAENKRRRYEKDVEDNVYDENGHRRPWIVRLLMKWGLL